MKKSSRMMLYAALCLLFSFAVLTVLVRFVDVRAIGPDGSAVGFAALNGYVHDRTGVHMLLYTVTDWLGLVPIATAGGFALLGLVQWIRRKRLRRVDRSILALGVFYIAVAAAYIFFEVAAVNYRPIRIGGVLEVSYPSSTTVLVLSVMTTAILQLHARIRNRILNRCITAGIVLFTAVTVIGRFLSGVHWFTDILGGVLLSAGLVLLYGYYCRRE